MKFTPKLFSRHLAFQPIDPMGDGLEDLIREEQAEQELIRLNEEPDMRFWDEMIDIHEA